MSDTVSIPKHIFQLKDEIPRLNSLRAIKLRVIHFDDKCVVAK